MKKVLTVLLVILGIIVVLLLAKDFIIKASVEKGVEFVTGLKLNIGSLKVGILKTVIDIKRIKLFNPKDFPDKTMVEMPEIYVNYDLPAIIAGKLHFPEIRLALQEFLVVKNAKGSLNLDAFKTVQAQKEGKPAAKDTSSTKAPQIKIDVFQLDIGKVIYKDYSKGEKPEVKEFNVNVHERYTNVDSPQELVNLIVVKALMNTSISSLTNFNLDGLKDSVGGVVSGTQKITTDALDKVKGILKNPFGSDN